MKKSMRDESGQAFVEYILLLSILAGIFLAVNKGLGDADLMAKMTSPIKSEFAAAYRYGHTKAKGYEDGGPKFHPRARSGESSFRIFINSRAQ